MKGATAAAQGWDPRAGGTRRRRTLSFVFWWWFLKLLFFFHFGGSHFLFLFHRKSNMNNIEAHLCCQTDHSCGLYG